MDERMKRAFLSQLVALGLRSEYQAMMAPYLECKPKAVPLPKELRGKGDPTAVFSREVG